ncbi:ABC transporter permease [Caballeronia sp. INDeC2]|uniref:ABC transporter permease n=1 Tax=Caballeronia sp. INDeC2 TaxID=2921747 RepID=UPI002027A19E|nr:ABC transporter permease [Caballeronia sp. INDeC2]
MSAVLYALVLREAVTRLSIERGAWLWMLLEPGEHIVLLMLWHGLVQHHFIPGVNVPLFIGIGVLAFFMMRSVSLRGMEAISANMALFTYRQIKPVDTVLARGFLEGIIFLVIGVLLVTSCAMFGADISVCHPLRVITGAALMWSFGMGLALTLSSAKRLIPEIGQIAKMLFGPLYYTSAALYPSSWIPASARNLFFLNPIVHGVEMMRSGYFEAYAEPDQVDPAYLGCWALCLVALGLFLHVRFERKLGER